MHMKRTLTFVLLVMLSALAFGVVNAQDGMRDNVSIDDTDLAGMSWDEIVAAAEGGTVNWFMWGGSDLINAYVSDWVGTRVMEDYGITVNRVGVSDTVDAVNIVLGEAEAGVDDAGSVDMIWINGENFRTLKQGGLLFCDYVDMLPNSEYVDLEDPNIAFDFGTPVDGCEVPWSKAQVALTYNSDFVEEVPTTMDELLEWACENPGSFAYPGLPDFNGSVFVRQVFYNEADKIYADEGGWETLLGEFDEDVYAPVAEATWETLNELEPCLWREGTTYPQGRAGLDQLFANTEVTMLMAYNPAQSGSLVESGTYPPSTETARLESGTIGNTNYVTIPYNSPNAAAAMVVANFLLSPEAQLEKAKPEVWGTNPAIDTTTVPEDFQTAFTELPRHPSVIDPAVLAEVAQPELLSEWLTRIEQDWIENVAEQ